MNRRDVTEAVCAGAIACLILLIYAFWLIIN